MDSTTTHASPERVLLVADWNVDPEAVVAAALRARSERHDVRFALLVPAWLHGIDWAGDPEASVPCARLQVDAIARECARAGIVLERATVGDPDPAAAMGDATSEWRADELLLFTRARRIPIPIPLDVASRARRVTGLPLRRFRVPFHACTHVSSRPAPAPRPAT